MRLSRFFASCPVLVLPLSITGNCRRIYSGGYSGWGPKAGPKLESVEFPAFPEPPLLASNETPGSPKRPRQFGVGGRGPNLNASHFPRSGGRQWRQASCKYRSVGFLTVVCRALHGAHCYLL